MREWEGRGGRAGAKTMQGWHASLESTSTCTERRIKPELTFKVFNFTPPSQTSEVMRTWVVLPAGAVDEFPSFVETSMEEEGELLRNSGRPSSLAGLLGPFRTGWLMRPAYLDATREPEYCICKLSKIIRQKTLPATTAQYSVARPRERSNFFLTQLR